MRLLLAFLLTLLAAPALAATLNFTPETATRTAWAAVKDGDTVILAPGTYSAIVLQDRPFTSVTVDARGSTINGMSLKNVNNFKVTGGTFLNGCVPGALTNCYNYAIILTGGSGFSLNGAFLKGPEVSIAGVMGAKGDGYGLRSNATANMSITNNVFHGFKIGIVMDNGSHDFRIAGNRFTTMRSDGVNVGPGSNKGLIERNVCDGTRITSLEHPDCIQMYSRPTFPPVADITIRFNSSFGDSQGFSGFNHVRDGVDDGGFDRITVSDNYVLGSYPQGIALYDCRQCQLTNNRVATLPLAQWRTSINTERSTYVKRCGNIVEAGANRPSIVDPAC
jgi:parallel beta-helix repeat protein